MKLPDNIAVRAENLSKLYKLYPSPTHKILDMLKLLRHADKIPTRQALNNINLEIRKGERLCFIGRNGAGKSTLLKLVSGLIKPTSGTIQVAGQAKALLQIGTGFYRELTGRDNVSAYLVQQGIRERDVAPYIEEIIEFSEIEGYIDQPVKTYSSGMAARLMFATSTAVTPDLLILDEILSVGDAYFTQKCIERVSQLCARQETTLLLVSHDIYSAAKLVERMIWIDNGAIEFDGKPSDILKIYENSIRIQEEKRLRKKTMHLLQTQSSNNQKALVFEIKPKDGFLSDLMYFSHFKLVLPHHNKLTISLDSEADMDSLSGLITVDNTWGAVQTYRNKTAIVMKNYGACGQKISFYFRLNEAQYQELLRQKISLQLEVSAGFATPLQLNAYLDDHEMSTTFQYDEINSWQTVTLPIVLHKSQARHNISLAALGSNAVTLKTMKALDRNQQETHVLNTHDAITFEFELQINDPTIQQVDILFSLKRNGVDTMARYYVNSLDLSSTKLNTVSLFIDKLGLGEGEYTVALLIAKSGYLLSNPTKFYSLNPDVYYGGRDLYSLSIFAAVFMEKNTAWITEGEWKVNYDDTPKN